MPPSFPQLPWRRSLLQSLPHHGDGQPQPRDDHHQNRYTAPREPCPGRGRDLRAVRSPHVHPHAWTRFPCVARDQDRPFSVGWRGTVPQWSAVLQKTLPVRMHVVVPDQDANQSQVLILMIRSDALILLRNHVQNELAQVTHSWSPSEYNAHETPSTQYSKIGFASRWFLFLDWYRMIPIYSFTFLTCVHKNCNKYVWSFE